MISHMKRRAASMGLVVAGLGVVGSTMAASPASARTLKSDGNYLVTIPDNEIISDWAPYGLGRGIYNAGPNTDDYRTGFTICNENIQAALNRQGYHLAVDGVVGAATNNAIRSFQASHHLTVDGLVGASTARALGLTMVRNMWIGE